MNLARFAAIFVALLGAFYFACLNHVSINEIGIAYDSTDGSIKVQHPGWHITSPMVQATTLSTLPFRVDLGERQGFSNSRVLNVKLVQFKTEHVKEFIETNGFHYNQNGMATIFTQYAFSGKTYPFLEIIDGTKP